MSKDNSTPLDNSTTSLDIANTLIVDKQPDAPLPFFTMDGTPPAGWGDDMNKSTFFKDEDNNIRDIHVSGEDREVLNHEG